MATGGKASIKTPDKYVSLEDDPLTDPIEECARHPKKVVDMLCETHASVGCVKCMLVEHNKPRCKVKNIPESIETLYNAANVEKTKQKLLLAVNNIEDASRLRMAGLNEWRKIVSNVRKELDSYTNDLVKTVTELNKATQGKIDCIFKELENDYSDQTSALNQELTFAKSIFEKVNRAESESHGKSIQVVCSTWAEEATKRCNDVMKSQICPQVKDILFHPHVSCKELFHNPIYYNSLGNLSLIHVRCIKYKAKTRDEIRVRIPSDKGNCDITGVCLMNDGTILLADNNNKCLKRMTTQDPPEFDYIEFTAKPRSVCVTKTQAVAVTLPKEKQVHLIGLGKTMKTTNILDVNFKCYSIAYNNGELYIADNSVVYVYTLNGELLRRFDARQTNLSDIRDVAVSGNELFVADYRNGLVAMESNSGRTLWQNTGMRASGVCVEEKGSVLASGASSETLAVVMQFSESGDSIATIASNTSLWDPNIVNPQSLCFDKSKSTIYVTQWAIVGRYKNSLLKFQLDRKCED